MYAVIDDRNSQIAVRPGQEVLCDLNEDWKPGDELSFDRVLICSHEGQTRVGKPYVDGVQVKAQVLGDVQGEKVRPFRFKRRKNVRVRKGHRQRFTRVRITGIEG